MAEENLQRKENGSAIRPSMEHAFKTRKHIPQGILAWICLIPALIFIVLFMVYPIINTFIIAFTNDFEWVNGAGSFAIGNIVAAMQRGVESTVYDDFGIPSTVYYTLPSFGIDNFKFVLTDQAFLKSLWNTFELVIIEVPLTIIISLLIAVCLNSIKALRGLYQTIFFLPYVTNTIALGMVFNVMFASGSSGLINSIFGTTTNWIGLGSSRFTQGVVIVAYSVWNGLAFKILVFMSGLATIDKQYYDAARIDGSSRFTIFRRITLPLLSPQILYITITSFIGAFKMYTGVRAVYAAPPSGNADFYFGGTDGTEWMTIVGWIYRDMKLTHQINPGFAAAGSLVLLVIILIITALQFYVSKKRVHY